MSPQAATSPNDSATLEVLLRRCALQDRRAFDELYRAASPRLLACLLAILRRRDLAEEALQETFVRIWHRANQFDSYRGRAAAWCSRTRKGCRTKRSPARSPARLAP